MEDQEKKEKSYHRKKTARILVSFTVFLVLLVLLFLLSVNIGSLKVSFNKLFRGLFIAYDQDVATVYDLRFPRIFISMLAGAAVAVSGVLFLAVVEIGSISSNVPSKMTPAKPNIIIWKDERWRFRRMISSGIKSSSLSVLIKKLYNRRF